MHELSEWSIVEVLIILQLPFPITSVKDSIS